jgi:adenylosuccinate lyase
MLIAFEEYFKRLADKLILNEKALAINRDLDKELGSCGRGDTNQYCAEKAYPKPYEALKDLTRTNKPIEENDIKEFIETLNVNEEIKVELRKISPHNYTGVF